MMFMLHVIMVSGISNLISLCFAGHLPPSVVFTPDAQADDPAAATHLMTLQSGITLKLHTNVCP